MNYLYIGYYVDDKIFDLILKNNINNMSYARQCFEKAIICGLSEQLASNIRFISYVPTDGRLKEIKTSLIGDKIVVNHFYIKKNSFASIRSAKKEFEKSFVNLLNNTSDKLSIIMYAVNPVFQSVVLKYKKKNHKIQLITITSEIPKLRRYKKSPIAFFKKAILSYYNKKFDGYVLLTEKMAQILELGSKPYIVIEGIVSSDFHEPICKKENIVMYAGGLAKDNNVKMLVDCCCNNDMVKELWICGTGFDKDYVQTMSSTNKKIKYFGLLDNNTVRRMENQSKILVNLRNPSEMLTRYSFPSKLLEYMSAGTLVITTNLEGIPNEYKKYLLVLNELTNRDVTDAFNQVFNMDDEMYYNRCLAAQEYVKREKNYLVQTAKIIDFVNEIK